MRKISKQKFITMGIALSSLTLFAISSCRKSFEKPEEMQQDKISTYSQTQYVDGAPTVLGAQYVIPFKVSEMKRAKDTLIAKNITPPHNFTVRTTHLYVKFTPANYEQLEILESDTVLEISAVPKDYLIAVQGSWYRAPGLADTIPNPQYASVQVGFNFPNGIPYQILDSLYIPDEDVQLMTSSPGKAECWYADRLMAEAYRINVDLGLRFEEFMPMPDDWIDYGGGTYTPPPVHGVIRVWDNRLNQLVPLEGVKIERRRHSWSAVNAYGYTNSNGEYSLIGSQSSGTSSYKIEFWRNGFKISNSYIDRFEIKENGMSRFAFSLDITGDTYEQFCATMFRGAFMYYYRNIDGLRRPFRTGFGAADQRIIARTTPSSGHSGTTATYWNSSDVHKTYLNTADVEVNYRTDQTFSTTVHELAHLAHKLTMSNPIDYDGVNNQIIESWAVAVAWQLTCKEYRNRGIVTYGNENYTATDIPYASRYAYQHWPNVGFSDPSTTTKYTSLFINLVDNFNENGVDLNPSPFTTILGTVDDRVSGYNLASIQSNYLKHCYSHSSMVPYLKSYKPTGVTNAQIDLLMSFY